MAKSKRGPLEQPGGDVVTLTPAQRARLKQLRLDRGFSTRVLAGLVGCSNGTITNMETGKGQMNRGYYEALVRVLGVDESDDEAARETYQQLLELVARLDLRGLRITLASVQAYLDEIPPE